MSSRSTQRREDLFSNSASRLKHRAVKGATLSLVARWCRVGSLVVTFILLARLLTPEDFGLVGMLTPFIALVSIVGDLGMSAATVQSDKVTPAQSSALFYLNMASGTVLAAGFAIASPFLAGMFDEPRVLWIGVALSLVFPLTGLAGQHQALLQRSLNFQTLLKADIISSLSASLLALAAAFAGFGYWSIVVRTLAMPALFATSLWLMAPWIPGRAEWTADTRRMIRFGGFNLGFNILNTTGRQMDNVLIGWRWGEAALGPYALAYRLFFTPVQQLTQPLGSVMVPALGKLRDDPERYRRWYLSVLRMIVFVGAPPLIAVSVASHDVIMLVIGSKWLDAVEILRWLAPIGAIHVAYTSVGWLNLSLGRSKKHFQWALVAVPVYLASFVIGLPYGAVGVAQGYFFANLLVMAPGVWWACRDSPVSFVAFFRALAPAAIACIVIGGAAAGALSILHDAPTLVRLATIGLVTAVVLAVGLPAVMDRSVLRSLLQKRSPPAVENGARPT